jgi:hypothetical protein
LPSHSPLPQRATQTAARALGPIDTLADLDTHSQVTMAGCDEDAWGHFHGSTMLDGGAEVELERKVAGLEGQVSVSYPPPPHPDRGAGNLLTEQDASSARTKRHRDSIALAPVRERRLRVYKKSPGVQRRHLSPCPSEGNLRPVSCTNTSTTPCPPRDEPCRGVCARGNANRTSHRALPPRRAARLRHREDEPPAGARGQRRGHGREGTPGRVSKYCPRHVTGGRARAWCLLIHADASLSLPLPRFPTHLTSSRFDLIANV